MFDMTVTMPSALACLTATLSFSFATCSPLWTLSVSRGLQLRQTVDCSDRHALYDYSCWNTLDIAKYLNDPITGWLKSTPACSNNDDGSNCCKRDEAWSTCFLRLAQGYAGSDCSTIQNDACSFSPPLNPTLSPDIFNQVRYVTYAITTINNFFTSMYHNKLGQRATL